jgi:hypothetical protein
MMENQLLHVRSTIPAHSPVILNITSISFMGMQSKGLEEEVRGEEERWEECVCILFKDGLIFDWCFFLLWFLINMRGWTLSSSLNYTLFISQGQNLFIGAGRALQQLARSQVCFSLSTL